MALKIHEVKVIDISNDDTVVKALRKDPAHDQEEALKDIYRRLRPGDPPTVANARALLKRLFFDPKKYDLGRVGRYKINQKLGINVDSSERILTDKDFIAAIKYLINLRRGEGTLDDIDHLGSRRVRTVGELLANQCRVGLARTERLVKERMTLFDINVDGMTPQKRINEFGFIETPYRKVTNGRVTDEIEYLTADREENFLVAQANAPIDGRGHFTGEKVSVRYRGDFLEVDPSKVNYMDVSPKQLVSVAAGLIPFLEHDDANRALMGSNMQRQGGPLVCSQPPLAGTGLGGNVSPDS